MSKDLLSGNFTEGIDRKLIKKILVLAKAVMSLSIIYTVIELFNWYTVIERTVGLNLQTALLFFTYRIYPFVLLVLFVLNIFAYSFNVKSMSLIDESVEENDADLFNQGFTLGFRAFKLSLISVCIAIASALTRLILK